MMMRTVFFAIALLVSSMSTAELTVQVVPSASFLLPGNLESRGVDCLAADVVGPRLHHEVVETEWTGEGDFYPVMLQVIYHRGAYLSEDYRCEITGGKGAYQSLTAFLGGGTGSLSPGDYTSHCPLECGSIPVVSGLEGTPFEVTGTLKLIGYQVVREEDGSLKQVPHTSSADITLRNVGW